MNQILQGGEPLAVTDPTNATHEVFVRLLKIKEFPDYFRLADDEEALAAFATGKDADFIAALDVGSVLAICEKVHDLNFQNACRWAERRAKFSEALLPVAEKGMRLQRALGNSAPAAPSPSEGP